MASRIRRMLVMILVASSLTSGTQSYSNFTLSSPNEDLSVVVYLPSGLKPNEHTYYYSSRFDHSSMIGSINYKGHELLDGRTWRQPHNINWPESGIGFAAEFGVGDDGAFCNFQCGWQGVQDVTNGLLGYQQAKMGESFLKIGVGELIKGTCPICDSAEEYKFNSPYLFAKAPEWMITGMSESQVSMEHQALLTDRDHVQYGYKLGKAVELQGNILSITSTLSNLGQQPFSTAWYSHNFFSCDGQAVGPGYEASLFVQGLDGSPLYEEPATWSWSTPIRQYAQVKRQPDSISVDVVRAVESGTRIKTEFLNDGKTKGGFMIRACDTQITSSIHADENVQQLMYAYGLYIERGTLSPEPQVLIHLEPGQTKSWTQRLVIEKDDSRNEEKDASSNEVSRSEERDLDLPMNMWQLVLDSDTTGSLFSSSSVARIPASSYLVLVVSLVLSAYAIFFLSRRVMSRFSETARRARYLAIPDGDQDQ